MNTTLTVPGKTNQIDATVEALTSQYGTPSPTLTILVRGDAHWRLMRAIAHRAAAEIEMALLDCKLGSLVEIVNAAEVWEGRRVVGARISVRLELVGDEKRMPLAVENERAMALLETVAAQINAASAK